MIEMMVNIMFAGGYRMLNGWCTMGIPNDIAGLSV